MAGQTINVSVLADTRQFRTAMAGIGQTTGLSRLASGAKAAGLALARVAAGATVAAGAAVLKLGKSAISSASDLQQSAGAVGTVFGKSSGQMTAWAAGAAKNVGLTKNEFNELGTLIGTQLKNGGTAMDQLGPKTNQLIGLGADLSSMFGGTTREAVEALSSALKGERDPIERYGVSLNQTSVDAEAARLGFKKVGGALSTEANQAATLSLIMKQTKDAHGNFARESDTLAHQQQVLKASLGNVSAELGTRLLPAATAATAWVGSKLPAASAAASRAMDAIGPVARTVGDALKALWAGFTGKTPTVDLGPWTSRLAAAGATARTALDGLGSAISTAASWVTGSLIPALTSAAGWLSRHAALVAALVAPIVAAVAAAKAYQATMAVVKGVQTAYNAVLGVGRGLQAAYAFGTYGQVAATGSLSTTMAGMLGVMRSWVLSLGRGTAAIARQTAAIISNGAAWVANKARQAAGGVATLAVTIAQGTAAIAAQTAALAANGAAWVANKARQAAGGVATLAVTIAQGTAAIAAQTGALIAQGAAWAANRAAMAAQAAVAGAVRLGQLAMTGAQAALNVVMSLNPIGLVVIALAALAAGLMLAWNKSATFRAVVTGAWTAVKAGATALAGGVMAALRAISGALSSAWSTVSRWGTNVKNAFTRTWTGARSATTSGINTVVSFVKGLPGKAAAGLSSIGRRIRSTLSSAWSAGRSATSSGISSLLRVVRGLPGRVVSALSGIASRTASIGRNIISGMVRGVLSAAGNLASAAARAVSRAIAAAKSKLGIHSPSRVFAEIGTQTVAGMVQGLDRGRAALASAGGRVAAVVTSSATPAPVPVAVTSSATTAPNVTINAQMLDPTPAVARRLVQMLRDQQRAGVRLA